MPPIFNNTPISYIGKSLPLFVAPTVLLVLKNNDKGTFSKRSGAAIKGFESCGFWFQMGFFNLNAVLCMFRDSIYVWKKIIAKFFGTVYPFRV